MRSGLIIGGAIIASILLALGVYWLNNADPSSQADSILIQDARPAGRGGANGGAPARFGGGPGGVMGGAPGLMGGGPGLMGGAWQMRSRDAFDELLVTLGELNLRPDFTLAKEQKEKLQTIRDAVTNAQVRWRAEHEDAFKKFEEDFRAAREAGGGARDRLRDLMEKRQDLLATAPTSDDAVQQIKALLTPEQLKMLDARAEQKKAETDDLRRQMEERMERFGGMRGAGRPNQTPPAALPAAQPGAPKEGA